MRGMGRSLSMPGEGKMFATAGPAASSSLADGGEFLGATGAEPLPIAVRGGTPSVAVGAETSLMGDGGERLAVAVGDGRLSSVAVGGEARMTGGGYTGTSGARGGETLAVGRADKTRGLSGLLHDRLRSPQWQVPGIGEPWSVTASGGASESGGPTEPWHRAPPCSQRLTKKVTANNAAFFNRILQSASRLLKGYSASQQNAVSLSSQ